MVKAKLYRIVRFGVVVSFIYLLFFENVWNIDGFIQNITNCLIEEVIYFKIVFMFIIITLVYVIKLYLKNNYSEFLNSSIMYYIKRHPLRSICVFSLIICTGFSIITIINGFKNYFVLLLFTMSVTLAGIIGFIMGKKSKKGGNNN